MKSNHLLSFSTIWDVIEVSLKQQSCLNIFGFLWTFYRVDWDFMPFVSLFCHKFIICKFNLSFLRLVLETNSFTWLKLHAPISILKLKKWSPIWTCWPYLRSSSGVHPHTVIHYCGWGTCHFYWCWYMDKGVETGDHEIKQ